MGNDLFFYSTLGLAALWFLGVLVVAIWPYGQVPDDKFGVETVGNKRSDTVVPQGNRGVQPRLLPAGTRYFCWRRRVTFHSTTVVPDGCVGVVAACVGSEPQGEIAPYNTLFGHFESVEAFLAYGGQQGVQAFMLPPGQYTIHPNAFSVEVHDMAVIPDECLGVVTSHIGNESQNDIIRHDPRFGDFTDVEGFLEANGFRGVQEAVLLPGTYAIHPVAFEVIVLDNTDSEYTVYGRQAMASEAMSLAEPSAVETARGTAVTIFPDSNDSHPTVAMLLLGGWSAHRYGYRVLRFITAPTDDVTIEWEVAIGVDEPDTEQKVSERLQELSAKAFDARDAHWSVAAFVAIVADLEERIRTFYPARVTEAVMLPTATARALED